MTRWVEAYGVAVADGYQRDPVTAAGMVGARHALAVSAWRLKHGHDAAEFKTCLGILQRAVRVSRDRNLKAARAAALALCKPVLMHWIADICPACLGRGAGVLDGSPVLEDAPCEQCGGNGRVSLTRVVAPAERVVAGCLLALLAEAEHLAASRMIKKLAREMEF
jgi:hypothetical protein